MEFSTTEEGKGADFSGDTTFEMDGKDVISERTREVGTVGSVKQNGTGPCPATVRPGCLANSQTQLASD